MHALFSLSKNHGNRSSSPNWAYFPRNGGVGTLIGMPDPTCPGCRELLLRVEQLEARVRELLAKLNTNSSNSSLPPSANPLGADKPVKKKKSKRQRGGQPNHPPHLKQLLPSERVQHFRHFVPKSCARCHADLPQEAGPKDPEPKRFQSIELPPITVEVTEYQAHGRTCLNCGEVTHATVPADVRAHSVGSRLTATLSYLTGCHGLSKRGVEEIAEAVFGAPIALGTVANLEQEVSAALVPAHEEALEVSAAGYRLSSPMRRVGNSGANCAGYGPRPRRTSPSSSSMQNGVPRVWQHSWVKKSKGFFTAIVGTCTC